MSGARYVREVTNAFRDCPCNYAKLRHFLGLAYSDARFLAAGIKFCCYFGAASRDSGLVDGDRRNRPHQLRKDAGLPTKNKRYEWCSELDTITLILLASDSQAVRIITMSRRRTPDLKFRIARRAQN
jgi:hypothetical protein